ncbi:MAG: HlyD family efflux transporter periplasmic adaptor subunit [Pseudomonadota bacterium]|nr:HlyD family efflux transporter periplasmic adaptor subunit [Pseudomonadota bacterium]
MNSPIMHTAANRVVGPAVGLKKHITLITRPYTLTICLLLCLPLVVNASADHNHDSEHSHELENEHEHEHNDSTETTEISASMANANGIKIAHASPGPVSTSLPTYATLVIPPQQEVNLSGRFPGLITDVQVAPGDAVTKGQLLAGIESNISLSRYEVRSPISGVISDSHAAAGNVATSDPLFVIVDLSELWLEIPVHPSQRTQVAVGQQVTLPAHEISTQIESIAPPAHGRPYWRARAKVPNPHGDLTPGAVALAHITTAETVAQVRVENRALQTHEGNTVVFVHHDGEYQARPVTTGASDEKFTEITAGLNPGEEYVTDNSYLIKADIGKSGAAHQH